MFKLLRDIDYNGYKLLNLQGNSKYVMCTNENKSSNFFD